MCALILILSKIKLWNTKNQYITIKKVAYYQNPIKVSSEKKNVTWWRTFLQNK